MSWFGAALIRNFEARDASRIADVFYQAVHIGAKDAYDEEQRRAWVPNKPDLNSWEKRIAAQTSKVAVVNEELIGFMTLTDAGKIDLAFVTPNAMGKGVSDKLYHAILQDAKAAGHKTLTTEASYLAKSFFKKFGWRVVQQQVVTRDGVDLTNFLMELDMSSPH
ncbi:MAG: GNAT family N-acetyltransferase [Hyphomicrobiales bacterium]